MKAFSLFSYNRLPLAALFAAATSGGVQAAINPSDLGGTSGELFMSVWDETAAQSYTYDLGVTVNQFFANATTPQTWVLDQRFVNFASTGDQLAFNIGGNSGYPGIITNGVVNSNFGVLASHLVGFPLNPNTIANASIGSQFVSSFSARLNFVNQSIVADNPGTTLTDYAANLSEQSGSSEPSYFTNFWGITMKNIPWTASAKVRQTDGSPDTSLDMYFIHGNSAGVASPALVTAIGTGYYFKLDPAAATLTWTTTAVPLPASVWLMLSALGGLGLFKRRERKRS